jgi:hypothetical protein
MQMRVTVVVDLDTTDIDIEDVRDEILSEACKILIANADGIQIEPVDPNETAIDYKSLLIELYKETDILVTNLIDAGEFGPQEDPADDDNRYVVDEEGDYWYTDVYSVREKLLDIEALHIIPE